MTHKQRSQNHDAAFIGQKFWRRDVQLFENESRETLEGQNVKSREAGKFFAGKQLPLELERGLFGREKNERIAFGIFCEGFADFGQAAESLAAAGWAEKESRLHREFFA
jgi:hypothetical protein